MHDYACPFERYQQHLVNVSEVPHDDTLFTDLIASLCGADNDEDVQTLPERVQSQLDELSAAGDCDFRVAAQDLKPALANLVEQLNEKRSLESIREPLGINKGRVGNLDPDKAIITIWEILKDQCGGLTIDQFFGFDPLQCSDGERPKYLGIIACHWILNFVGYRTDKGVSRPAAIPNIMSDGSHIAHAAFCDLLISADRRLCAKASAIYKYMGIGTQVGRLIHSPST